MRRVFRRVSWSVLIATTAVASNLHAVEPVPEESTFSLIRPVDYETEVSNDIKLLNISLVQPLPMPPPPPPKDEAFGEPLLNVPLPTKEEVPAADGTQDLPSAFETTMPSTPIDMATALALVNVRNPSFLLAQQRVLESMALRQLAAAQFLPTLNMGSNYDDHTGPLQQSNGNILTVDRSALYVGAGANAVAAGTVNVPGVMWQANTSDVLFGLLQANQLIDRQRFASLATRNNMGMQAAAAYLDVLEAEGRRAIALQMRRDALELARITEAYARTGQGRHADANRAATELADFDARAIQAEGDTFRMSARLAQVLALDQSLKLQPTDNWVVPHPLIPEPIPLRELLAIAAVQRPELAEYRAAVQQAMFALRGARLLPFSPNIFLGMSGGVFGGGSNLVSQAPGSNPFAMGQPQFSFFDGRSDFDAIAYWTLKNCGIGNSAMIEGARARLSGASWQRVLMFENVRRDVANAYALARTRLAQVDSAEMAIRAAIQSWNEDLTRIRGLEGLPIEAVNSLQLLSRSRLAYLDAIISYNRAQFQLYVALGQPPVEALVRPVVVEPMPPVPNGPMQPTSLEAVDSAAPKAPTIVSAEGSR